MKIILISIIALLLIDVHIDSSSGFFMNKPRQRFDTAFKAVKENSDNKLVLVTVKNDQKLELTDSDVIPLEMYWNGIQKRQTHLKFVSTALGFIAVLAILVGFNKEESTDSNENKKEEYS